MAIVLLSVILAEICTSCFVPRIVNAKTGIHITATLLNVLGGGLEGFLACYFSPKFEPIRNSYLGVFTSYTFMVEHSSVLKLKYLGVVYIMGTLVFSCVAYGVGRSLALWMMTECDALSSDVYVPTKDYKRMERWWWLFVVLVFGRATFGAKGFVRDPNDPKYVGKYSVQDGYELFMGCILSYVAIRLSMVVSRSHVKYVKYDWGTWRCNVLSTMLCMLATHLVRRNPSLHSNFLLIKFATSFCGSLSCFSTTIGHTMSTTASNKDALLNLWLNASTAIVLSIYFVD